MLTLQHKYKASIMVVQAKTREPNIKHPHASSSFMHLTVMDDTLEILPKYNWDSMCLDNISDGEIHGQLILTACDLRPVSIDVKP